jgi:uncharacterized protein (DUF1501 family)
MNRRAFLQLGLGSLALLATRARAARATPRARACIVLWMNGGPSHVDTFDPKRTSTFKPIATRAPDVKICEHLPQVAEQMHHVALLRGLSSKEGNHDRAQHLLHTGYAPNPTVAYPSLGGWVSSGLGDAHADLPAFVSIDGPSASAGFLGAEHDPFVVGDPGAPPDNTGYSRDVSFVRFVQRKAALDALEADFARRTRDPLVAERRALYQKAVRLMYSPRLNAFDLTAEPAAVRAAYGDTDFGRGCLLARRLVEAGVHYVEVVLDGWDTHQNNFARTRTLMGTLDPAMASLLRELDERHLLNSTLVVWAGDFGRTPKVNENEGRDHFPAAWTVALAGGGLRGGVAVGRTDDDGARVVDGATRVPDLFATIATQLGLDPARESRTPRGRPITLTDGGRPIDALL